MTFGALFCNADCLSKGHYIALPVIAWDIVIERAAIPRNYFSELIVKILSVTDKSIQELHDLTNLDERLIRHILEYDLGKVVFKSIDKWHLTENTNSEVLGIVRSRVTVLQSMLSGNPIPHPVYRNNLKILNYELNEKGRPKICEGTKGKPSAINPYIIFPNNTRYPDIIERDIYAMWDEYEYNDSELATSAFDGIKSKYIEQPEKIVSIIKRSMDENTLDFLLVKVNTFAEDEQFECADPLEPTTRIPMACLTRELKIYMEKDEKLGVSLGLKEIDIPLELKDVISSRYPKLTDNIINEACRLFTLKDKIDEMAKDEDRMDDVLLSRFQSLYECILRGKDVLPLPDSILNVVNEITSTQRRDSNTRTRNPKDVLIPGLVQKGLTLDSETLGLLYAKSVWRDLEKDSASLKSLVLRHLLIYLKSNKKYSWFVNQLVNKDIFNKALKFILNMAQIRNTYQHYHANRQQLPYSYDEFFNIVEQQLEIINEVY